MSEIDTANRYMVGVKGDTVVVLLPPTTVLTKQAAFMFAAWLVSMADILPGEEIFEDSLAAVQAL